jgi:2,4-dienoyl-CoA reductase-like NADH-dependent reductase (Old Yellow Enzyme family)
MADDRKKRLHSPRELAELAASLSLDLPISEDLSVLGEPIQVGDILVPNSLAIHPMEGCDGDVLGRPGPLTVRRYERYAAGGAGLIWVEAIAVVPEGRANPRQLWMHEGSYDSIAAMVARIRNLAAERFGPNHRPLLVAQLTHSGRYSHSTPGERNPQIPQHDPYRDEKMKLPADWPVVTDEYLGSLPQAFLEAARMAFQAGFDAVDVKACHGYLLPELLASHTRPGIYGGPFENRVRLMLDIVDRIRSEFGEGKIITTRLGVFDAIPLPYGWGVDKDDYTRPDLAESMRLIELLVDRDVPMVNVTVASPYYNPHYGRPFNTPARGAYESPEHPLVGVARIVGLAGQIQKAFPKTAIIGTGYSWLGTLMPYVAAGAKKQGLASLIGLGRMAIAYPDFAADILQHGRLDPNKVCIACSYCTQIMRDGGMAGCPVRDKEVYGPIYRAGLKGEYKTG